jgi:hemolysin III
MDNPQAPHAHEEEHFSLPLFLFTVVVSLAGLVGLLKLLAPESVWSTQLSASAWHFAAAFAAIKLFNCFMEFGFHRYVLHKPVVPFLSRFYKQHTLHHNLTRIGRRRTPGGREVPYVENIYPITEPEQGEASFFPWYTLAIFGLVVTPLLALLQWLAPAFPWFFAGYAALTASLLFYELFHAIEHWPFERWAPLIEHPRWGFFWRKVYSFHLRHHAVIDCNESISGFFTLPVADWVFGTVLIPKTLYVDGAEWRPEDFVSPKPCGFIRWCDAKSDEIIRERRAAATNTGQPTPYSRGELIAHRLTHGLGLGLSIAILTSLAVLAALYGNVWHIISFIAFGISLVVTYAVFARPRQTRAIHWRELFHKYNHAAGLLLIAGTATPFALVSIGGAWGWSLFGVVWGLCLTGALFRLFCTGPLRAVSTVCYVLLGILAIVALKPVLTNVPQGALWLLLAGIACYLCGAVFHLWQRIRYHHVVRHVFALGGSACHVLALLLFVLPMQS